jgi:hypothetical protein
MSLLSRIPLRESRNLIVICAITFLALATVFLSIHRPAKEERIIRKHLAEGKVVIPESYVPVWLYKGLKANVVIAGLALLASPWLGQRRGGLAFVPAPASEPLRRWELIACVALMGFAAWQNAPRLHHSMWGDEEYNASRYILDNVERTAEGKLEITPRSWMTTLWNMRKPTNHLGYSFFARLTHDAFFEKKTGATDPWFSEALLRAPVFISGLLLIPSLLWSLRVWGLQPWWALLLLVVHPWFVRFGVDGRGYGFVMLGAALLLGILGRALQTAKWRWWIAFGLGNFFIIWSNFQSIYLVAALNMAAMIALWQNDLKPFARWLLLRRLCLVNVLSLVLIVGYLAPCWPQMQEFMQKREISGPLDADWWQACMTGWLFGQPWMAWDEPTNPYRYAMELSMKQLPALHIAGVMLLAGLFITGALLLLKNRQQRPMAVFFLGAPALMILHMFVSVKRPYDWYFSPYVPGLCALASVAGGRFMQMTSRATGAAALIVTVSLYAYITREPRSLLRTRPLEPARESVALYRSKVSNPRCPDVEKDVISAAVAIYTAGYDPLLLRFKDLKGLQELMAESDRSGRELFINMGYMRFVRLGVTRDACAVFEDPAKFDHVASLYGLLPYNTRDVYRYRKQGR